jgi:hypothetical protein
MVYSGGAWIPVGAPGFSSGKAVFTDIKIYNNAPFAVFSDGGNGGKATVMNYNGSSWQNVGNPGFTPGTAAYLSMAIDTNSGYIYVVFSDWSNL